MKHTNAVVLISSPAHPRSTRFRPLQSDQKSTLHASVLSSSTTARYKNTLTPQSDISPQSRSSHPCCRHPLPPRNPLQQPGSVPVRNPNKVPGALVQMIRPQFFLLAGAPHKEVHLTASLTTEGRGVNRGGWRGHNPENSTTPTLPANSTNLASHHQELRHAKTICSSSSSATSSNMANHSTTSSKASSNKTASKVRKRKVASVQDHQLQEEPGSQMLQGTDNDNDNNNNGAGTRHNVGCSSHQHHSCFCDGGCRGCQRGW